MKEQSHEDSDQSIEDKLARLEDRVNDPVKNQRGTNTVKNGLTSALSTGLRLYVFLAIIVFVPYYNWRYAHNNGFIKWLAFREFAPTLQGIVWPYGLYADRRQAEKDEARNQYLRELGNVVGAMGDVERDTSLVVGRAQERARTQGGNAGNKLLGEYFAKQTDAQRRDIERYRAIKPPPGCREFHEVLIERLTGAISLSDAIASAYRDGDQNRIDRARRDLFQYYQALEAKLNAAAAKANIRIR
jgi:hypothetical protein